MCSSLGSLVASDNLECKQSPSSLSAVLSMVSRPESDRLSSWSIDSMAMTWRGLLLSFAFSLVSSGSLFLFSTSSRLAFISEAISKNSTKF